MATKLTYSVLLIFLFNCSASFEEVKKITNSQTKSFNEYLFAEYKEKAIFEAEKMHDWNSAKLYSEKALLANKGWKVFPQKLEYWKLQKNSKNEIKIAYDNLIAIYEDSLKKDPYNLAKAVSSLDCWSEQQEEKWQSWHIKECKEDFLNSMHILYSKITKKVDNIDNNKTLVFTKNKNKKITQIIYFDFDEAILSDVSINTIKKYIEKNKYQIKNYTILGYTDTKGTKKYNLKLSLRRANAVRKIFTKYGIENSQIRILGKGEDFLAINTDDEVKHPANRRAEIITSN